MKARVQKLMQRYLQGEREGFSLVELIIVIAIMAILIAVVALAVIPYLSSARDSKDRDAAANMQAAFKSAMANEEVAKEFKSANGKVDLTKTIGTTGKTLKDYIEKYSDQSIADATKKLAVGDGFQFEVLNGKECVVKVMDGAKVATDSDGKNIQAGGDDTATSGGN